MPGYDPSAMVRVNYRGKTYAGQVLSYSKGNNTYDIQITYEGRNIVITVPASSVWEK